MHGSDSPDSSDQQAASQPKPELAEPAQPDLAPTKAEVAPEETAKPAADASAAASADAADKPAEAEAGAEPEPEAEAAKPPEPDRPMLRPIEAYPVDHPSGQKLLALYDPSGLAPDMVTLPPFGAAVIDLCDGTRTHEEICAEFLARYKRALPRESLDALLKKLDDALLLDSLNFRLHCARLFAEYAESDTRPLRWSGARYPDKLDELTRALESAFQPPNGPGLPSAPKPELPAAPRALIIPSVDFTRGGPAYAWAYRALLDAKQLPPLIVLIGTDHSGQDPVVTLTRKHFATPFGPLETDVALVEQVLADATAQSEELGELLLRDEFHYRAEHSLEFQALWLAYVISLRKQRGDDSPPPKIVPLLVGSLHELVSTPPNKLHQLEALHTTQCIDRLVPLLQQRLGERIAQGQQVLFIASADLAHVGPRFGDLEPLSDDDRDSLEHRDRETLKPVLSGDAQGFLAEIRRERDRRRVLGLSAIYTFLQAARVTSGHIRCYAQCSAESSSYISTATIIY